jgi:hypothetical protein
VALICLVLSALAIHRGASATPDDALITYRYAQNLLDGHGWVYDLHRSTSDAATAPLYTLLLAIGGFLVGGIWRAATFLFCLTTAATGYLSFALLRRHSLTIGGLGAACLMIVNPWLLVTRGMETSTFLALLLLATLLLDMQRYGLVGFVLAAATFVRGDAGIVAAVAFVLIVLRARRHLWRFVVGALAAAVPWLIFATLVIGSPIPDTFGAKTAQGESGFWGRGYIFVRGITQMSQAFHFTSWAWAALAIAIPGLLSVVVIKDLRRGLGLFVLGVALIFFAYGFVFKTPAYHWYYGPQVALMALCGGVTIGIVARAATRFVSAHVGPARPEVSARQDDGSAQGADSARPHRPALELSGLLEWATGAGCSTDMSGVAIQSNCSTYKTLTSRVTTGYALPPVIS